MAILGEAADPRHCFSVDLEDWYHSYSRGRWATVSPRVEEPTAWLLRELKDRQIHATFFVLGYVADRHPELIARVAAEGHEIGLHGYDHQPVFAKNRTKFAEDINTACRSIEDAAGTQPSIYRAPEFSINLTHEWVWEVLADNGITRDSSLFPARAGQMSHRVPMHPFQFSTRSGVLMTEFPIVHGHLLGHQVPFCGGGYFRLLPLDATLFFFNRLPLPGVFYIHPRDLDPGLPPIDGLSHMQHFKVYHGLGKARAKLARLFNALEFGAIGDIYADRQFEYRELYA